MPNHCHNRVTIYGDDTEDSRRYIAEIKQMFEDENTFTQIIPEPDWKTTPNKDGELPVDGEYPYPPHFPESGITDDRWYNWRVANWDTKWDACDVDIEEERYGDNLESFTAEFETAWSPPEAICHALREMFPDMCISWFYDEPGMEFAGYL